MSFLKCKPTVYVIGNEYEIAVHAHKNGIIFVKVGGESYYTANNGCLSSEKSFAKIRVPQKALDSAKKYEIVFRETINRKSYFSEMGDAQTAEFEFKPIEKTDNINIYHIADVHYLYDVAKCNASYFGEECDLFVVNGDIGEVESEQNYYETSEFVGEISGGKIPVLFVRGNHDTRGKLAEKYGEYFPVQGAATYFTFEIGCIGGVALDCGEDKFDSNEAYNGTNIFEKYRREELKWLKGVKLPKKKYTLAVSHICPAWTSEKEGNLFDIERELYKEMTDELNRLKTNLMLCGHLHKIYVLEPNDTRSFQKHNFHIVIGSQLDNMNYKNRTIDRLYGTAVTLCGNEAKVSFTDQNKEVLESRVLKIK